MEPDGGLEGGVGVGEAGQKVGEGVRGEGDGHGVELGGGHGEGVAVGEPVEASFSLTLPATWPPTCGLWRRRGKVEGVVAVAWFTGAGNELNSTAELSLCSSFFFLIMAYLFFRFRMFMYFCRLISM